MAYLVGELIHMLCQTREAKAQAQGLNLMHFKWTLAMAYLVGEQELTTSLAKPERPRHKPKG